MPQPDPASTYLVHVDTPSGATATAADTYTIVEVDTPTPSAGDVIVPLTTFQNDRDALINSGRKVGVWIDGDVEPEEIAPYLSEVAVVAIRLPVFTDGRGMSLGVLLRTRLQYRCEMRAFGGLLPDSWIPLRRCGFSSAAFADENDAQDALHVSGIIEDNYQASVVEADPKFRRSA